MDAFSKIKDKYIFSAINESFIAPCLFRLNKIFAINENKVENFLGIKCFSFLISKQIKGEYACIRVILEFRRDLTNYINIVYIPSSMVVCLSFISFYIDHHSAAARAPLG